MNGYPASTEEYITTAQVTTVCSELAYFDDTFKVWSYLIPREFATLFYKVSTLVVLCLYARKQNSVTYSLVKQIMTENAQYY